MSDPFWTDDIDILFDKNRLVEFFPTRDQTNKERLNSISRLIIYSSIALAFYNSSFKPIIFMALGLGVVSIINSKNTLIEEPFGPGSRRGCTPPTRDNPFMNVQLSDYYYNPDRPPACDPQDPLVKEKIEDSFEYNLYKDVGDIFNKYHSQREFVTNPSTTIPNDRDAWAHALFGNMKSCKDNPYHCEPYSILKNDRKDIF